MITVPTYFGALYKSSGVNLFSISAVDTQINTRNGTYKTIHSVNASTGSTMLVLTTANELDSTVSTYTITSNPPLTWVRALSPSVAHSGMTDLWWASFVGGGYIGVTASFTGEGYGDGASSVLYVINGSEATPLGYSASVINQTAPSMPFTSSKSGSIVIMSVADWGAVSASVTFRGTPITSSLLHNLTGVYTAYHWRKAFPTITSSLMGISNPNTMYYGSMCLMEIRPA